MTVPSVNGSVLSWQTGSKNNNMGTVTVPADTDMVLLFITFWEAAAPDPATLTLNGSAFTLRRGSTNDFYPISKIYYIENPTTGTFVCNWSNAPDEGAHIVLVFLKDVDLASPFRSDGAAYSTSTVTYTATVATSLNDLLLCVGSAINVTQVNGWAGTQNELYHGSYYDANWGVVIEKPGIATPTSMAIAWTGSTVRSSNVIVSIKGVSTGHSLTANNIVTGAPTVGSPSIGQTHILSANNVVTGSPVLESPTFGQSHILSADGIETGNPSLGSPTLGVPHVLTSTNITTGNPTLGSPTIGQTHVLTSNDIVTGSPTIESSTIGQTHILSANNVVTGSPVLGSPTLGESQTIKPAITGSIIEIDTSSNGSQGITVPSDCDLILVLSVYYYSASTELFTLLNTGVDQDFTSIGRSVSTTYGFATAWYLANPITGSRTLSWNLAPGVSEGAIIFVVFLKNVDPTSQIRSFAVGHGPTGTGTAVSGSIQSSLNDLLVSVGYSYNTTDSDSGISGQTEVADSPIFNNCQGSVGIKDGVDGSTTMSAYGTYPTVLGVSVKGTTGTQHELSANDIVTGTPTLGSPTIGQSHILSADNIVTGNPTIGSPTIEQTHVLTSNDIVTGSPTVEQSIFGQTHILSGNNIVTGNPTVGNPSIGSIHNLDSVSIITGNPTVEQPTIGQTHVLSSSDILTGNPIVGESTFGQTHLLDGNDISTDPPVLGTPTLSTQIPLIANDILTGTPEIGTPTIGQTHVFDAVSIVCGTPVVETSSITQTHLLNGDSIVTGNPEVGSPTLTTQVALIALDIITGNPQLDSPEINQTHLLDANDISTDPPVLGSPVLTQTFELIATNITTGSPVLGSPTLHQTFGLVANDILTEPPIVEQPAFGQTHILTSISIVTGNPILDSPILSETVDILGIGHTTVVYADRIQTTRAERIEVIKASISLIKY